MKATKVVGLIQAHHRGWAGARDFSLARVNGKYAVEEVIDRLKAMPQVAARDHRGAGRSGQRRSSATSPPHTA